MGMLVMNAIIAISGYKLGDIGPAGGLIIYKKSSPSDGWQYLELAPKTWNGGSDDPTGIPWGCEGLSMPDLSAWGFSNLQGKEDTAIIVRDCSTSGIAAKVCNDLTYGGFSDWYLPALGEFHLMSTSNSGLLVYDLPSDYFLAESGIQSSSYWTATQSNTGDNDRAISMAYSTGGFAGSSGVLRSLTNRKVRPMRRF